MRMHATAAAVAAVLLLALTGCTGTPQTASSSLPVMSDGATQFPSKTPEPLKVTETPTTNSPAEATYLERVRKGLAGTQLAEASDAQLLDAAKKACDQLAQGTPYKEISVVDGDTQGKGGWYQYSAPIVVFGGMNLCPDVYPADAIHP
ncbi:DUF732 domain-containing protein [Microbacterium sp. 22303]|uniref:DUF732 domain-containing protein n=1 Tax=Microbacterium sp. 22303 TaxID=3453905 RepID=UPI003F846E9A